MPGIGLLTWEFSLIGLSLIVFTLANIMSEPKKHRSDWLLCCWLAILGLPLLHQTLSHFGVVSDLIWRFTNPTLNLLHGPLLYAYLLLITRPWLRFKKRYLLHFLPFLVLYLTFVSANHSNPMIPNPGETGPEPAYQGSNLFLQLMYSFGVINALSFLAYSAVSIRALARHQTRIGRYFSQNTSLINLKWIYTLPASFALIVIANVYNEADIPGLPQIAGLTFHLLSNLLLITLLCFFGLKQKPLFRSEPVPQEVSSTEAQKRPEEPETTTVPEETEPSTPDSQAAPDESDMAEVITLIKNHMVAEKPYLSATFSVYNLADAIKVPRREVSHALNQGLSKNFFQFVNDYRIDEVKTRLQDSADTSTILDIAFESGFSSKSSFNSLFKKHTGQTPSQYRKSQTEVSTSDL